MTDTLTPLDATFLELEQDDDAVHMHIGAALVFDPRPDGSRPAVEELRDAGARQQRRLRAARHGPQQPQQPPGRHRPRRAVDGDHRVPLGDPAQRDDHRRLPGHVVERLRPVLEVERVVGGLGHGHGVMTGNDLPLYTTGFRRFVLADERTVSSQPIQNPVLVMD